MMAASAPPRMATTWLYENHNLMSKYRTGVLWVDSVSSQVCWQSADTCTEWHGEYKVRQFPIRQMIIKFDCHGRESHLKTTMMIPERHGWWVGADPIGRNIRMRPITDHAWDESSKTWRRRASFDPTSGMWICQALETETVQ